ncbi:MAG: carbohydrate transporter rane protein 1, family [Modestobacter sp.]|jgi:multiple sugar transport system permease protein|nr:carbohydrate transporter rane protein 1, family [Modestobacter sp.]
MSQHPPQAATPAVPAGQRTTERAGGSAVPGRPTSPRSAPGPARGGRRRQSRGARAAPWLLMSPSLALLLVMTVFPAAYIFWSSVHSQTLLGGSSEFVGLQNYTDAVTDPGQRHSLLVTVAFVVVAVVLELVIGLLLALPLAAQSRSNNVATALMLLPFAVTPAVSALVFRELANPNYGWIDWLMGVVGLPAHVEWLSNPSTAWMILIGLDVWQWTPFVALILMAGLQSMPTEPLEAAAIDGAGRFQTFRYVKLPLLTPFLAIAVVLRTIQAFKTFDSFKVLTGGGPGSSTENLNLDIYRVALQSFRIGAASATAVIFLLLLSLLVPLLLRVIGRGSDPDEV